MEETLPKKSRFNLKTWFSARFPINEFWRKHLTHYHAPKNFNFWYYFGSFSLLVLVNQIVTGIWLTMDYTPTADRFSFCNTCAMHYIACYVTAFYRCIRIFCCRVYIWSRFKSMVLNVRAKTG